MLRKLRVKFVIINMTLVTVMLAVIFGLLIHQTQENLESQSLQMMQSVASDPFPAGRPGMPFGDVRMPYFMVQVNEEGEILSANGFFFDLSDEELIEEITKLALANPGKNGTLDNLNMRFLKMPSRGGETIVFADMTGEIATMQDLIHTSILVAIVAFAVFLVISFQLAKWAVKPVAEAWDQQKQFVADASHELKTPLTVIMTNAELLSNPESDDASKDRFASSILTMSVQMRGLVEGLLDLARVDNGAVRTDMTPLSLSELTEEACMIFEPLFFERDLMLEGRIEPDLEVRGSETHLQQVLKILLDNAMKYSESGTVRVSLQKQGSGCLLTVANPGAPIAPEDRKNIFKRFYRVDKSRHRDGSYGLGLSIAENIVQEHQGRIWVESADGENCFHIYLPSHKA